MLRRFSWQHWMYFRVPGSGWCNEPRLTNALALSGLVVAEIDLNGILVVPGMVLTFLALLSLQTETELCDRPNKPSQDARKHFAS